MKKDIFYVIWNPESGQSNVTHEFLNQAEDEAKRLAINNPDKKFFVLKALSYSVKKSCDFVKLENQDIPF